MLDARRREGLAATLGQLHSMPRHQFSKGARRFRASFPHKVPVYLRAQGRANGPWPQVHAALYRTSLHLRRVGVGRALFPGQRPARRGRQAVPLHLGRAWVNIGFGDADGAARVILNKEDDWDELKRWTKFVAYGLLGFAGLVPVALSQSSPPSSPSPPSD